MCFNQEVGTGLRDELPVLPVFVSWSVITSALCASQRSHFTIFKQLQTIVVCVLFSMDKMGERSDSIRCECENLESGAVGKREEDDMVQK